MRAEWFITYVYRTEGAAVGTAVPFLPAPVHVHFYLMSLYVIRVQLRRRVHRNKNKKNTHKRGEDVHAMEHSRCKHWETRALKKSIISFLSLSLFHSLSLSSLSLSLSLSVSLSLSISLLSLYLFHSLSLSLSLYSLRTSFTLCPFLSLSLSLPPSFFSLFSLHARYHNCKCAHRTSQFPDLSLRSRFIQELSKQTVLFHHLLGRSFEREKGGRYCNDGNYGRIKAPVHLGDTLQ